MKCILSSFLWDFNGRDTVTRIRSLKPEIVDDAKLATASRDARLTFVYLITQADNYGYILAPPRKIAGLLYPHDIDVSLAHVANWLTELAEIEVIRLRETRDGTPVVEMANWERHQKLDKRGRNVIGEQLSAVVLSVFPFRSDSVPTPFPTVGVGSRDLGPREQGTGDRGGGTGNISTASALMPEEYRGDFDSAIRASHKPEILAMEITTLARGKSPSAEGATPEDVGRGLRELLLNGVPMGKLTSYVCIAMRKRIEGPPKGRESRDESYADLGKRLDAHLGAA